MTTANLVQITLELWGAFFTLVSAITAYVARESTPRRNNVLTVMLVGNTALLISDTLAIFFRGYPGLLGFYMVRISNFIVFMATPFLAIFLAHYLMVALEEGGCQRDNISLMVIHLVGGLDVLIIILSQFTGYLYSFDENNVYHRSDSFLICSILGAVLILLLVSIIFHNRKYLTRFQIWTTTSFCVLPFVSNIIQLFYYGLSLNNVAITIALLSIFLTHQIETARNLARHRQELAEIEIELMQQELQISKQTLELSKKDEELAFRRLQISISQMQPHFIFNALSSIEQLCEIDGKQAAEATDYFAQYLRTNLQALSSTELVPFRKELDHVYTYVWLEEMRFGDDIQFLEEIEVEDFYLPSLTIQPLVENAIKHGMIDKEEGAITVTLWTKEEEDCYLVIVEDDGYGFDQDAPPKKDYEKHTSVGLANTKERIELMTQGSLEIKSVIGKGTTVTIRIPKEKEDI